MVECRVDVICGAVALWTCKEYSLCSCKVRNYCCCAAVCNDGIAIKRDPNAASLKLKPFPLWDIVVKKSTIDIILWCTMDSYYFS